MEKMDQLPTFVLKFALIEAAAVALIIIAEWGFCTKQFAQVQSLGYSIPANHGEVQLGKYSFVLYRFEKLTPEESEDETAQKKQT